MYRVRGASGDVLARGPGFPPDLSPRAPPSPPVFSPPETFPHRPALLQPLLLLLLTGGGPGGGTALGRRAHESRGGNRLPRVPGIRSSPGTGAWGWLACNQRESTVSVTVCRARELLRGEPGKGRSRSARWSVKEEEPAEGEVITFRLGLLWQAAGEAGAGGTAEAGAVCPSRIWGNFEVLGRHQGLEGHRGRQEHTHRPHRPGGGGRPRLRPCQRRHAGAPMTLPVAKLYYWAAWGCWKRRGWTGRSVAIRA